MERITNSQHEYYKEMIRNNINRWDKESYTMFITEIKYRFGYEEARDLDHYQSRWSVDI